MSESMQVDTPPYEILIRFCPAGSVRGAHVIRAVRVRDAQGNVVAYTPGQPEPAGQAGDDFRLAELLGDEIAAGLALVPMPGQPQEPA